MDPYDMAQKAIADLKSAICALLRAGPSEGMSNAKIGRTLGIYMGHKRHVGHIPRTLLAILEKDGLVVQDPKKLWRLCGRLAAKGQAQ